MASPLGFSEAGRHFYNAVLIPFVAGLGYEVGARGSGEDRRGAAAAVRV